MNADKQLFDREKALACFGSAAILQSVMQDFLTQAEGMFERLQQAALACDHQQVRQGIHWFRGGLVYLHSQEAETACHLLDEVSAKQLTPEFGVALQDFREVLQRLQQRVQQEL